MSLHTPHTSVPEAATGGSYWLPGAFKRSVAPKLIAWFFICFSALVFYACIANVLSWLSGAHAPEVQDLSRAPAVIRFLSGIANFRGLLGLLEAPFAAAGIVGGIGLLALRSWGRTLVEGLTWLGLFGLVLYGVLWLAVVASLGASAGVHGSVPWWFVLVLLFVGGLAVFAVMARALLTILSNLRSPNLRAAINAKRTAMRAS